MRTLHDLRPVKKKIEPRVSSDFWQERKLPRKSNLTTQIAAALVVVMISLFFGIGAGFIIDRFKTPLALFFLLHNGKFLVLFQNNAEQRPTGGFMGSFAKVEMQNFKIKKYFFETNVHKKDAKFIQKYKIAAPRPFQKVWPNSQMALASSNYHPDFPNAARDILWYYNQEYDDEADAVIALNASSFSELLKYIGEIQFKDENVTLTSDNFIPQLVYLVERKYFENPQNKLRNEPKTILKNLVPQIVSRLKKLDRKTLLYLLEKNLLQKQIVFYFQNPYKQSLAASLGWSGEIKKSNGDYLYISNANLGGAKSSLNVKQNIDLEIKQSQSKVISDLEITRQHQGDGEFPDGDNRNYTRVLLPKGTKLLKAEISTTDFTKEVEISEISGKTVLGFWFTVKVGETKTVKISYQLPFEPQVPYQILVQKQPGEENTNLSISFNDQNIYQGKLERDLEIEY